MDFCVRTTDSILTRARNCLVAKFMETTADDMLFLDSDVWASPGSFTQIMKHDEDIVGGCYPHRGEDHDGFVFRPLEDKLMYDPKTGLMEVDGVATGFMRIRRNVFERLQAEDPENWYYDTTQPGSKIFNWFDFKMKNHQYWSEDYVFSRTWRAMGGKCWVDPELELSHEGLKVWKGRLGDWLRKKYAATLAQHPMDPMNTLVESKVLLGLPL